MKGRTSRLSLRSYTLGTRGSTTTNSNAFSSFSRNSRTLLSSTSKWQDMSTTWNTVVEIQKTGLTAQNRGFHSSTRSSDAAPATPTVAEKLNEAMKSSDALTVDLLATVKRIKEDGCTPELTEVLDSLLMSLGAQKENVKRLPLADPEDIFTNDDLSLEHIDVFGFDYDYTLASYTDNLQHFIYDKALAHLIDTLKYPESLRGHKYDPSFAIRGLHYDKKLGNLIKLDFHTRIQVDAAYFGRTPVPIPKLYEQYPLLLITNEYVENLQPLSDIFCLPEVCLLSDVIQHFTDNKIEFSPAYVCSDVTSAVESIHATKMLHREVVSNLPKYLNKHPHLGSFLSKLRDCGKEMFLATNSPFWFIDKGMEYLLKDQLPAGTTDWKQMFDIILTKCNKPNWFTVQRPMRMLDVESGQIKWNPALEFKKGSVYVEGSMDKLVELTGWSGNRVLYFGDHIINDLREPSRVGWKTGVIIRELEAEVTVQNSLPFRTQLAYILELDNTLKKLMFLRGWEVKRAISDLKAHRNKIRTFLKTCHNKYFGSAFRTHRNATMFSQQLQRYVQVYTSKVENFLDYPMDYVFYPNRSFLPHEVRIPLRETWQHHHHV